MSDHLGESRVNLTDYDKFHISVDCVIFGYEKEQLKILVMDSDLPEYRGKLSLVGGMLDMDSNLRQTAQKVLYKYTNLQDQLRWVPVKDIKEMAFDHKEILNLSLKTLREKLRKEPIGFNLLPKKFTIQQLQSLYEAVLDIKLDKRNFRRKLSSLDVLKDLEEYQKGVVHRPAKLYEFNLEYYLEKKEKMGLRFGL